MKAKMLAVVPLFFACAVAAEGFSDKVDRFTGVRTISWLRLANPGADLGFSTGAYVLPEGKGAMFDITLVASGSDWRYLRCNFTSWLVDGKPAPYIKTEYINSLNQGATIEMMQANLNKQDIQRIAYAKTVEYQVCNDEGALTPQDLQGLRRVVEAAK